MGMNYYAKIDRGITTTNPPVSGRFETMHIGKSSQGWRFGFRGYPGEIDSYQDLLEYLSLPEVTIVDEMGRAISIEKFKDLVESKKESSIRDHAVEYPEDCWIDAEGHGFHGREFS